MGRTRRRHFLARAKDEALFACDLYNERRREPNLEAFVVHMQIAWLNLLTAIFERDGVDYYYRKGRRFVLVDGERKCWDVTKCIKTYIAAEGDPVRTNLLFFIGLRNKIEHRFNAKQRRALGLAVAGRAQSLIANFESALVTEFGQDESLADELRFPIFLSSLTSEALDAVKALRSALPRAVTQYITDYDRGLSAATLEDQAYEFRVLLIPMKAPKSKADASITFVDERNLTAEQRQELAKMTVIVRDRFTEVGGTGRHLAGQVVTQVKAVVPTFKPHNHTDAWRFYGVRPPSRSEFPERTTTKFCVYERAFKQYTYTDAWIAFLKNELAAEDPMDVLQRWHAGPSEAVAAAGELPALPAAAEANAVPGGA
jgi:hypothetical protein